MLSMLIKPASGLCNLRCSYCFYHTLMDGWDTPRAQFMDDDTVEALLHAAFAHAKRSVTFGFQGGEPTMCGLDFFERFAEKAARLKPPAVQIRYVLQTNGMAVDGRWAEFFQKHRFLIGLSLDGPRDMHDAGRVDAKGKGSYARVLNAARILEEYRVDFNILCVVTGQAARHAAQLYEFFKKQGFRFLQFIPCLTPMGEPEGNYPYALTSERYARFLKTLFDLWYRDWQAGQYVSIRLFDNCVHRVMGLPAEQCAQQGHCTCQFVVEADGGVYPCDFYVTDEWRLGNIREQSVAQLKAAAARFETGSDNPDAACGECRWFFICRGGCRRDREGSGGLRNAYCEAFQDFYTYAYPRLENVARAEYAARR